MQATKLLVLISIIIVAPSVLAGNSVTFNYPTTTIISSQNITINNTYYISNGTAASVALANVTGSSTNACTGTDKVKNITFINGIFYVTCAADNTGAGGTYNVTYEQTTIALNQNYTAFSQYWYNQTAPANIYSNSVNNSLWTLVNNTFYLASNPSGFITASVSTLINYFTKTEVNNSIYGNVSDKPTYTYVNTVVNGNASVSGASTTYVNTVTLGNKTDLYNNLTSWVSGNQQNFNVNSSNYWDNLTSFVGPWLIATGPTLDFNFTRLTVNYYNKTDTVAMISGNVSGATTTYVNNVVSGNATNVTNWVGTTLASYYLKTETYPTGYMYNRTEVSTMLSQNMSNMTAYVNAQASGASTTYVNNVVSGNATNVTNWVGATFYLASNPSVFITAATSSLINYYLKTEVYPVGSVYNRTEENNMIAQNLTLSYNNINANLTAAQSYANTIIQGNITNLTTGKITFTNISLGGGAYIWNNGTDICFVKC